MTGLEAVASVLGTPDAGATQAARPEMAQPQAPASRGFGSLISSGVSHVEAKVDQADALVHQFALDDSIPIHQVTMAIEEARLAVELAVQVRTRLIEGYREIMNMQL